MRPTSKTVRRWCALVGAVAVLCIVPSVGRAWKPYTHNTSALAAYWDAVDDGFVTIGGNSYAVAPGVAVAMARWPAYYNAGVIGPDGFPDLTYGQSVIHPGAAEDDASESVATGEWLRHVLRQAQAAQTDSTYTTDEKQQILAFAYGYLTHAAGDMWGHSFINDFARGVFPGVGEILTSPEAAGIAARHLIAEGYVGDATPGFDADRDSRETLPDGDVSDDSTPGFAYDAPHRFVYETLIRTGAGTPSTARGPIIDFFLDVRSGLEGAVTGTPPVLSAALQLHREAQLARDAVSQACDTPQEAADCLVALAVYGGISFAEFLTSSAAEIEALAQDVLNAYLVAWKEDIDTGLRNWSKFGLATTKGLFDAQTRRTLQNAACAQYPDESSILRADCEAAIGLVETVLASSEEFILSDLLSMAGAPDAVGDLATILKTVMSTLQPLLTAMHYPFNPVNEVAAVVKAEVQDLIADAVAKVLGVDIRTLQAFLTQPHRFTCVEQVEITLPGELGTQVLEMFRTGDHHRLDGLIGLPGDHHLPADPLPIECGPLADAATFELAQFKAMQNTITTAKLLLLGPAELNRLLGVTLGRQISTYVLGEDRPGPGNVMVQHYGDAESYSWLRSIDADHGWRHDGLPRFCNEGGECPPADAPEADPRPSWLNGGAGSFPIWESCVLRPAFRALFLDWETAGGSFPDLGDDASADEANDPNPPQSFLGFTGRYFLGANDQRYVAEDHAFTHTAADLPAEKAFAASGLRLRRRVTLGVPQPDAAYTASSQNDVFTLGTVDGTYQIDLQAADPCHGWAGAFPGSPPPDTAPANVLTATYVLDTTAPVISCVAPPFGRQFDSDDTVTVDYDITDGIGSGVASSSATVDGYSSLPGVVSTTDNALLDLSQFYPGTRTVAIATADNLQHSSSRNCTFVVQATAASLQTNVQVARKQGLITSDKFMSSLLDTLRVAERQHQRGQHSTEWNTLEAFISQLMAQSGKAVDPALAARLIAFARDIIENRG